ncbi:cell wall-binding protein YocH [Weizmannia acidilactici]|uniref:Cell wall-binding protein YocH n=1 Tax=Weizmannia acidilactici TaxID=2607726 RepID=A0A5J4J7M6_9BACI|nr:3D domain-containing protein [Weizmannia acidilactici]GER70916.1 cell wall-binding protein YocH [Weizmannia acidilactici]
MKKAVTALAAAVTLTSVMAANASAAAPDTYTVKQGDTLWGISKKYNTSVKELKQWNQLSTETIYPAQKLKISPKKVYVIKAGDTLSEISAKYGVTVEQLKKWNDLPSNIIFPNDDIVIHTNPRSKITVKDDSADVSVQAKTNTDQARVEVKKPTVNVQTSEKTTSRPQGRTITVTATAYTANDPGCSGVTATGINLKNNPDAKVIAVDPNVIPLGSKVYVEGYGTAVAGDTGGAIKGNRIDVLVPNTGEAMNWGRRTIQVTILD